MADIGATVAADSDAARRNAEVVQRFFDVVLTPPHDLDRIDDLIADDFVDRTPDDGDTTRAGVMAKLAALFTQDPAASFALEALVAAGDGVAAFSVLRTGGAATRFADLYVLRDGRIAEHRHVVEPLSGGVSLT